MLRLFKERIPCFMESMPISRTDQVKGIRTIKGRRSLDKSCEHATLACPSYLFFAWLAITLFLMATGDSPIQTALIIALYLDYMGRISGKRVMNSPLRRMLDDLSRH